MPPEPHFVISAPTQDVIFRLQQVHNTDGWVLISPKHVQVPGMYIVQVFCRLDPTVFNPFLMIKNFKIKYRPMKGGYINISKLLFTTIRAGHFR